MPTLNSGESAHAVAATTMTRPPGDALPRLPKLRDQLTTTPSVRERHVQREAPEAATEDVAAMIGYRKVDRPTLINAVSALVSHERSRWVPRDLHLETRRPAGHGFAPRTVSSRCRYSRGHR